MRSPPDTSKKLFAHTGILFTLLFGCAFLIETARIARTIRPARLLEFFSPLSISLLALAFLFSLTAILPQIQWLQPFILLALTPAAFCIYDMTIPGISFFMAGIILLVKQHFFTKKGLTKSIILLIYLYICEVYSIILDNTFNPYGISISLLAANIFLIFFFVLHKDGISVYLNAPKPPLSLTNAGLTKIETAYLKGIIAGNSLKEIAFRAEVTDSTVRNTFARIYKKLDVIDRASLLAKLEKFDIVD